MKSQTFINSGPASIVAAKDQLTEKALLAGVMAGARFDRARQDALYVLAGPLPKPVSVRVNGHFTGEKRVTFGSW